MADFVKAKTVNCPMCNSYVGVVDNRAMSDKQFACRNCNILVIYRLKNGSIETKPMPERQTSSGCRFY